MASQQECSAPDLEALFERFDCKWRQGEPPSIAEYLGEVEPGRRRDVLLELVRIDLEYRWKSGDSVQANHRPTGTGSAPSANGQPKSETLAASQSQAASQSHPESQCQTQRWLLEDYAGRFPELGPLETAPADLVAEEYLVRKKWGDAPGPEVYVSRFGSRAEVSDALRRVDADLAASTQQLALNTHQRALSTRQDDVSASRTLDLAQHSPKPVVCWNCRQVLDASRSNPSDELTCPTCGAVTVVTQPSAIGPAPRAVGPVPGRARLGRFELIERIGQGAFGEVWRARDSELDRLVAIKIPRQRGLSEEELRRFDKEAIAAARLRHAHIVTVYEVGHQDRHDVPTFIVTELVAGDSLDVLVAQGPLPTADAAELCRKVAEALAHAHENGIVHRDLKPRNILVDRQGQPRLTDFGLAKLQGSAATLDGQILGTAAYIPPEQARGKAIETDGRADIYSLGVILYEVLTCRRPFDGDVPTLLYHAVHTPAAFSPEECARLPVDLRAICLRCLEKDPARRFQTAQELATALADFGEGKPLRPSPVLAPRGALRRRKWLVAGGIGLSLAAVVLLASLAVPYLRAWFRPEVVPAHDRQATFDDAIRKLAADIADKLSQQGQAEVALGGIDGPVLEPLIQHRLKIALEQQQIGTSLQGGVPLSLRVSPLARWRLSGDFYLSEDQVKPTMNLELKLKDSGQLKHSFEGHIEDESLRDMLWDYVFSGRIGLKGNR